MSWWGNIETGSADSKRVEQRDDAARNLRGGVRPGARARTCRQPIELRRPFEDRADGRVQAFRGEPCLRQMNRRAGSLERRGVDRLVVGRGGRQRNEYGWDPP